MKTLINIALPSRANEHRRESGMDSLNWFETADLIPSRRRDLLKHFSEYPHQIEYQFNSRGFRDLEWPDEDSLKDAIWCIGDSFTLGIGSPVEHTWSKVLQHRLNRRTINVSMDGASNEWISKTAEAVLKEVKPCNVVIMWSYIHRRHSNPGLDYLRRRTELTGGVDKFWKDFYNSMKLDHWPEAPSLQDFSQLPEYIRQDFRDIHVNDWLKIADDLSHAYISDDLNRRIHVEQTRNESDIDNIEHCLKKIKSAQGNTNIVQAVVPQFAPSVYVDRALALVRELAPCLEYFDRPLDYARDSHHFDIKTSNWIVDQLVPLIK